MTYCQYYAAITESTRPSGKSIPHPDGIHHITRRAHQNQMVCRLHFVGNGRSELFFLRCLLAQFPARSYEELRIVKGERHPTFEQAAKAHGLVKDDEEYLKVMQEADKAGLTASHLRHLLCSLIVGDEATPSRQLWESMKEKLYADFFLFQKERPEVAENSALSHIAQLLRAHGRSLSDAGLPECLDRRSEADRERLRWSKEDDDEYTRQWKERMSDEQKALIDRLLATVPHCPRVHWPIQLRRGPKSPSLELLEQPNKKATGTQFFVLLAPGGSGKTAALTFVVKWLRSAGHIVLCTASTGIAALNFPGGTTLHSLVKLPLDAFDKEATCSLSMRSERAELIRSATGIIVDEFSMLQRNSIRAFERCLADIKPRLLSFVVLCGDMRQIPPIIKGGTKDDILRASIRCDVRWEDYNQLRLSRNMRAAADPEYAAMCERIGTGAAETVRLEGCPVPLTPLPLIQTVADRQGLISFVFPRLTDPHACVNSAILAATNQQIDEWNEEMLRMIPGQMGTFLSADTCEEPDGAGGVRQSEISQEILNGFGEKGVPPHRLQLKKNTVVMLLRNMNFSLGLANSKKLIVRDFCPSGRLIICEEPRTDGAPGERIPIHRITFKFRPSGHGMEVTRRQFPLRTAYCLTQNKGQGQTLDRVGIDLTSDPFAHGQLYVDLTRVRSRQSIRVLTHPERIVDGVPHAVNVVYPELLVSLFPYPNPSTRSQAILPLQSECLAEAEEETRPPSPTGSLEVLEPDEEDGLSDLDDDALPPPPEQSSEGESEESEDEGDESSSNDSSSSSSDDSGSSAYSSEY